MPAGYAVARARPLLPRAEVRAPSAVRPPSRGRCPRGGSAAGIAATSRDAPERPTSPAQMSARPGVEFWRSGRIVPFRTQRPRRGNRGIMRKPPSAFDGVARTILPERHFLRPAPRGPAGAFPTDPSGGARGCRDARPTGSPSGRRVGIAATPRDLTPRDAPGRRRRASFRYPWSSGVRLLRSFPFTTPLHPPLYEKKRRSGGSRGVVDGKRRSRGAARTGTGRSDDCPRARLSRR